MKCPECDSKHATRYGPVGKCYCGYQFKLEGLTDPPISDKAFLAIQGMASTNGTRYYTFHQLYFQYCRWFRKKRPMDPRVALAGAGVVFTLFVGLQAEMPMLFLVSLAAGLIIPYLYLNPPAGCGVAAFQHVVDLWKSSGGDLEKMIDEPRMAMPPEPGEAADLYDYGVERLVIVEKDILVDLFVLNGWHAEQKALVLSERGYPSYLVDKAKALLNESPELPVFLLHDATAAGMGMAARLLREKTLPLQGHPVTDLGLSTADHGWLKAQRVVSKEQLADYPVDMVGYGRLAGGLAAACVGGVLFAELMDPKSNLDIEGYHGLDFG